MSPGERRQDRRCPPGQQPPQPVDRDDRQRPDQRHPQARPAQPRPCQCIRPPVKAKGRLGRLVPYQVVVNSGIGGPR